MTILPYKDGYLIASFNEVVDDYSKIIKRLNKKFNTKFIADSYKDLKTEDIFKEISKPALGNALQVPRPSPVKKERKKQIQKQLETDEYKKLLEKAESLYYRFLEERHIT